MEKKSSEEIAKEILNKSRKIDTDKVLETTRMLLLVVAGFTLFNAVFLWSSVNVRYILLCQMLAFIFLYVYSKNNPLLSFIIGLILYVLPIGALTISSFIVITFSFFSIFRGLIIVMLVWGIIVSYRQNAKNESNKEVLDSEL